MEPDSLYRWCQHHLLSTERHLVAFLDQGHLPISLHVELFVEAVFGVYRSSLDSGAVIKHLVATWPQEGLILTRIFPDNKLEALMGASDGTLTVLDWIIEGLLSIKPQPKLKEVHFSCLTPASIFHLPVLFLSLTKISSDELRSSIISKGKCFVEDDEMMESILSWKLAEIKQRKATLNSNYHGPRVLDIYLETRLSLTEWMAMVDQVIGISTQHMSPYRYKFTHLSVDNFNIIDSPLLKWFLSEVDLRALTKLYIYGKTKCMSLVMWELNEQLSKIPHLKEFGLGTAGPKEYFHTTNPNENKCTQQTETILENWRHLQELHMVGLVLSTKVHTWLSSLQNPLHKLTLYDCKLVRENLRSLASSHHLSHLQGLGLEKNDLRGCGEDLTSIVKSATRLEILNLVETNLRPSEKFSVVAALEGSESLHTLVMYDHDDMLTGNAYQSLVERACRIPSLKEFYVFPFNYKPFEMFHRKSVEDTTEQILRGNSRTDMQMYY